MSLAIHEPTTEALRDEQIRIKSASVEETKEKNTQANASHLEIQSKQKKLAAEHKEKLMAVSIDREQVAVLAKEFNMTKDQAELVLRENGGVLLKAVQSLLSSGQE